MPPAEGSDASAGWERWNTQNSISVIQEVFGHEFRLRQDPNSNNLGTTVWDASIVLAKYLEHNSRRGELSRNRVNGKRAVELGSGMGLAGMALAMMGCDVMLTDVESVLPLLQHNYQHNLSPAALAGRGCDWICGVGTVNVLVLDWTRPEQREAVAAPVDFILAADCVYHEDAIRDLRSTIWDISGPKTISAGHISMGGSTTDSQPHCSFGKMLDLDSGSSDGEPHALVANELRSESVHSRFLELFSELFTLKKVPRSRMHPTYQHSAIDVFVVKRRKEPKDPSGLHEVLATDVRARLVATSPSGDGAQL